jgi:hypothetical protein
MMHSMKTRSMKRWAVAGLLAACAAAAWAQTAPTRLRATVQKVDADSITVKDRSGEVVKLAVAADANISEVYPIELSSLKPGVFIGTAAMPQPDGSLKALEVHVFPESMRGTGEGHRPFDLQPGSTMTNATVADLAAAPQGRKLTLHYKDGEKTVVVPDGVPVVSYKPGNRSLLVDGAKIIVTAELRNGQPTATRVIAGRNGFAPPM